MSTPIIRRRKKAVEVDTIQWTGANETDVQAFTGGASKFYALDDEDRQNSDDPDATATVFDELHSTWLLVYTGQHIVRGVKGEFYPIAEDVLAETYELVDGSPGDGQVYDGELAMLRGLVRTLRAVVRDDRAEVAQREVRRLLYEHAADERDAYQREMGAPAPAAPDFFQPGHTYTEPDGSTDWQFRCDAITTHPEDGQRTALGWRHFQGEWTECAYREDEFDIHLMVGTADVTDTTTGDNQ